MLPPSPDPQHDGHAFGDGQSQGVCERWPNLARDAAAGVIALLAMGVWAWSQGLSGPYHFDDYT